MDALVGYTGFVGGNICEVHNFDKVFNSRNIEESYGLKPDLLVYSGMRAEKFLANRFPEKDMELVEEAEKNIRLIAPKKLVLISTIDVYRSPVGVNEDSSIELDGLQTYGKNRYLLEIWVRENYPDALIIRLPGLFGKNLKKNFIYDYINKIPSMLKKEKMDELANIAAEIRDFYTLQENGFYKCRELEPDERRSLREDLRKTGFSAVKFTDSRSVYQFYPLSRLWRDIEIALKHDLRLWNPATEPVSVAELYHYLSGDTFVNETGQPVYYDFRTKYAEYFGGIEGYILSKEQVMKEIEQFVESMVQNG